MFMNTLSELNIFYDSAHCFAERDGVVVVGWVSRLALQTEFYESSPQLPQFVLWERQQCQTGYI